ncbi:MAG TPA: NYN domain-containing protein, partial [Patescibacteria group bacterium]|nr:NYN domain-containing protein [Patescibacteria group bacterium]
MSKNVAVFVDVANIFYAAKAAGVDIDYVTLLKASSAGRDLVRAYAYTGLDPDNENQRNFHDFLRRHGYKVVSKDIRKYGDGKVKANLDIELVVDMMKTARNLDIAIVVSGDGDFAPAIRAVQEQGVRVEVVSFRGNTSSDLMDVADQFTDITQIAKVEKGSSRSGRRVSEDEADLSMTEVPEKQSEGTGERSRGRGRTRRGAGEPAASRGRGRAAPAVAASDAPDAPLVVLPGEKLSRAAASADTGAEDIELEEPGEEGEAVGAEAGAADGAAGEEARRRRRRRGGRGRGRGRGRDEGFAEEGARPAVAASEDEEPEDEAPVAARRPTSAFGSVWDSQIGISSTRATPLLPDDEDLEEPAVPEYLLAERRQRDAARGRGGQGRGGRGGAYAAALDRERFGGGRGSTRSSFQEQPRGRDAGFGRDDRPRDRDDRPRDRDRGDRQQFRAAPRPAPRPSGDEPWSEVPPEIEAMLRAQLGSRPAPEPRRGPAPVESSAVAGEAPAEAAPAAARRSGRRTTAKVASADAEAPAAPASARATTRRPSTRKPRASAATADADAATAPDAGEPVT